MELRIRGTKAGSPRTGIIQYGKPLYMNHYEHERYRGELEKVKKRNLLIKNIDSLRIDFF